MSGYLTGERSSQEAYALCKFIQEFKTGIAHLVYVYFGESSVRRFEEELKRALFSFVFLPIDLHLEHER
jgi:hypothetical protein